MLSALLPLSRPGVMMLESLEVTRSRWQSVRLERRFSAKNVVLLITIEEEVLEARDQLLTSMTWR